jgi:hypothetical protein
MKLSFRFSQAAVAMTVLTLTACQLPFGPKKILQLYDGAPRDEHQVAVIRLHDTKANRANMLEKVWTAGTTKIDGAPTQGYTEAHVAPGKHSFSMYCRAHDPKVKPRELTVEYTVIAGKTYYPWAAITATVIRGSGQPALTVPGAVIGELAAGYCTPFLDTRMADLVG